MIKFDYSQMFDDELVYRFTTDSNQSGMIAFNQTTGAWRYMVKLSEIPDIYTPMFAAAANKVMNSKVILKKMSIVCF